MKLYKIYKQLILENNATANNISNAIHSKRVLVIDYENDGNNQSGRRTIEPYCLGKTKKSLNALRAYQTSGVTSTSQPDWKIFLLNNIKSIEILDTEFEPNRQGFNPNGDNSFQNIYLIVNNE